MEVQSTETQERCREGDVYHVVSNATRAFAIISAPEPPAEPQRARTPQPTPRAVSDCEAAPTVPVPSDGTGELCSTVGVF